MYLRIFNGQYQIGSWNGTDHFTDAPSRAGDYGTWVHLAGVYDGTAWHLYRNGLLLESSTIDPIGAVAVAAGWAVGTTSVGDDRFFTGDIDDIRIWNRPLGPQEITDGMSQPAGRQRGRPGRLPVHGPGRPRRPRRERGQHEAGRGHSGAGRLAARPGPARRIRRHRRRVRGNVDEPVRLG